LKTPPSSSTPSKGTVEAMPSGSVCCEREPGVDTARRSSAKTCSHHASASVSPSRAFELQSKAKSPFSFFGRYGHSLYNGNISGFFFRTIFYKELI
jgi:hypothetical protein